MEHTPREHRLQSKQHCLVGLVGPHPLPHLAREAGPWGLLCNPHSLFEALWLPSHVEVVEVEVVQVVMGQVVMLRITTQRHHTPSKTHPMIG